MMTQINYSNLTKSILQEVWDTLPAPWVRHLSILRCAMLAYYDSWRMGESGGYEAPLAAQGVGDTILSEYMTPTHVSTDNFSLPENMYWNRQLFEPLPGEANELQRRVYESALYTVKHQFLTFSPYRISE